MVFEILTSTFYKNNNRQLGTCSTYKLQRKYLVPHLPDLDHGASYNLPNVFTSHLYLYFSVRNKRH